MSSGNDDTRIAVVKEENRKVAKYNHKTYRKERKKRLSRQEEENKRLQDRIAEIRIRETEYKTYKSIDDPDEDGGEKKNIIASDAVAKEESPKKRKIVVVKGKEKILSPERKALLRYKEFNDKNALRFIAGTAAHDRQAANEQKAGKAFRQSVKKRSPKKLSKPRHMSKTSAKSNSTAPLPPYLATMIDNDKTRQSSRLQEHMDIVGKNSTLLLHLLSLSEAVDDDSRRSSESVSIPT